MLTIISYSALIASVVLTHFDRSLVGLLFSILLLTISATALCADIAVNKMIKHLNKRESHE
jgi:hypothetical protein